MRGINNNQLPPSDQALYLDGVLQRSLCSDAPYHEGLVHLGMLAHHDPRRVAIIGSGEKATLQEVLSTHMTVREVIMLEIDGTLLEMKREVLREWNNCSKMEDCYESCFDDDRVRIHFCDAFQWFIDHFSSGNNKKKKAFHQRTITPLQTTELLALIINI
ncbi:hypothetical protein ACHAW6_011155 [Cyclotella cf. meneghiniana]